MLTYYAHFLPNLSTVLAPLNKLLRNGQPWRWSAEQGEAFKESKRLLLSSKVLTHFDAQLEVRLTCDSSAYGVGAVLSHVLPDGTERPVGFAS